MKQLTIKYSWKWIFVFCLLAIAIHSSAEAAIREVGQGKTYSSIQAAVNAAVAGDTVRVYTGTYNEEISTVRDGTSGSKITIECAAGNSCTINGQSTRGSFRVMHSWHIIHGFTLTNCRNVTPIGAGYTGGCIQLSDWPANTEVRNITAGSSNLPTYGLIYIRSASSGNKVHGSNLTVTSSTQYAIVAEYSGDNTEIYNNTISGAASDASIRIANRTRNGRIYGNYVYNFSGSTNGAILTRSDDGDSAIWTTAHSNVLVAGGVQAWAVAYWRSCGYFFYNNTIIGGGAGTGQAALVNVGLDCSNSPVEMKNNIIVGWNRAYQSNGGSIGTWNIDYNIYHNVTTRGAPNGSQVNFGGNELLNTNPLFTLTGSGAQVYRVQPNSPAVNSGTGAFHNSSAGVPLDFDGISRPQGGSFDRGGFEYQSGADTTPPRWPGNVRTLP